MSVPDMRATLARPAPALWLSIALHVAVLYGASRVQWLEREPPERTSAMRVVWLDDLPTSIARLPEPLPEPAPAPTQRDPSPPPPEPERAPSVPPEPEPASEPDVPAEPDPPPAPQAPAESSPADEMPIPEPESNTERAVDIRPTLEEPPEVRLDAPESAPYEPPSDSGPSRPSEPRPEIDWAAERERAVAMVLEQRASEQSYRSLSSEELFDEPEPQTPETTGSIFEGSGNRGGGPSALRVGESGSRFLNGLAKLCNALTGGMGLSFQGLSLGSACTERGPRADFFAHLRPRYLEQLPVCTESPDAQAREPMFDADGNEIPTVKCRLVDKDEIDGLPVVLP